MKDPKQMDIYELRAEVRRLRAMVMKQRIYMKQIEELALAATSYKKLTATEKQKEINTLRREK